MFSSQLSTLVKALRLRVVIPLVVVLLAVYWLAVLPWMNSWGATPVEQQMVLPGDAALPAGSHRATLALTINAPPEVVWQWLAQVGQDRAGFYTYTWLENLFGADIHNANQLRPEWQTLDPQGVWRLLPADYLGGVGKDSLTPVLYSEPGRVLVMEMWGEWVLQPLQGGGTRLIVRGNAGSGLLQQLVITPVVFTMERRMLLGLKARAEGRPDAPLWLSALALPGWLAAGVWVCLGFARLPSRQRYWAVLALLPALPALFMAGDPQAALAALIAAGITILGFLHFGRRFWGAYLLSAALVLLGLLLAAEAYSALGLVFTLSSLVILTDLLGNRTRQSQSDPRRAATPAH